MSTERAEDIDLAEAQRVADQWMAVALRRIATDPDTIGTVAYRLNRDRPFVDPVRQHTVAGVIRRLADVLEHDERSEI